MTSHPEMKMATKVDGEIFSKKDVGFFLSWLPVDLRLRSLRETLAISLPLMLASLSLYIIHVVDRFILACFSLDALNAAVQASTFTWAFWGGITVMAGMSEIVIAQSRAEQRLLIGQAVWNSIWLSVAAGFTLIPIAFVAAGRLYGRGSVEYDYFFWSMLFGLLQPLFYALTSFFVGQGKTRLILLLALATTLWNAAFDYALIFGIDPWIPSLGAKGAAIAGGLSMALQISILLLVFLRKKTRASCGTGQWKPHFDVLVKFFKIATPPVILYNLELWGWSIFYTMMAATSTLHITIASLCQSLIYLFTFISEGLYRGTLLQANNCLAQGKEKQLRKIFVSASCILGMALVFQLALLAICPKLFLSSVSPLTGELLALLPTFEICTLLVLIYMLFQGVQWLLSGFLCAIGQGMPMLIAGSSGIFLCLVLPTYFMIQKHNFSVEWAWGIVVFYSMTCCLFYGLLLTRLRKKSIAFWSPISMEPRSTVQLADKAS